MRTTLLVILTFLLLAVPSRQLCAKEVNVKEIKLSLFNKPVVGYRLFLDKSNRSVTNQILRHVGKFDVKPFQFEKTVIYENIKYPPVTEQKPISLYYLLHDLPGNYTEMTVVAMYDYKRSINTDEFPDLAIKLLADIAQLVDKVSGDVVRFEDMVLDKDMLTQLEENLEQRGEEIASDETIEHFQEEEVENNSVRIKKDPFDQNDANSVGEKLAARITELEKKEKKLNKKEEEYALKKRELDIQERVVKEMSTVNDVLRDSVKTLNARLQRFVVMDLAGDGVSVSAEDSEALTLLEDELKSKETKLMRALIAKDSLQRSLQASEAQLQLSRVENDRTKKDLREMRVSYSELKAEFMEFKSKVYADANASGTLPGQDFARESMADMQRQNVALMDSVKELNAMIEAIRDTSASLPDPDADPAEVASLQEEIESLESEREKLKASIREMASDKDEIEDKLAESQATIELMRNASENNTGGDLDQQELVRLQAENLNLKRSNDELKERNSALDESLSKTQAQLAAANTGDDPQQNVDVAELNKLRIENDQLAASKSELKNQNKVLEQRLEMTTRNLSETENRLEALEGEEDDYKKQIARLKVNLNEQKNATRLASVQTSNSRDSLRKAMARNTRLSEELQELKTAERPEQATIDSLQTRLNMEQRANNSLNLSITRLNYRVDSLSQLSRPKDEQERILREKQLELTRKEAAIAQREAENRNLNKLLSQREAFLEREKDALDVREERYRNLETYENELKLLEQRLKQQGAGEILEEMKRQRTAPANTGSTTNPFSGDKREVTLRMEPDPGESATVPMYVFDLLASETKAEKQIAAYMTYKGFLHDARVPNLVYDDIRIPNIHDKYMTVVFRMESMGARTRVKASFKIREGEYIEPEEHLEGYLQARTFLQELTRYNP